MTAALLLHQDIRDEAGRLIDHARQVAGDDRRTKADYRSALIELADVTATLMNLPLSSCGGRHLGAERQMRFVERFGWPRDLEMIEWLSANIDDAGDAFNSARLARLDTNDEVPF